MTFFLLVFRVTQSFSIIRLTGSFDGIREMLRLQEFRLFRNTKIIVTDGQAKCISLQLRPLAT